MQFNASRSPIEMALLEIQAKIPPQILRTVFDDPEHRNSIRDMINKHVIQKYVRQRVNTVIGRNMSIPMEHAIRESTSPTAYTFMNLAHNSEIWRIPGEYRANSNITSITNLIPSTGTFSQQDMMFPYMSRLGNNVQAVGRFALGASTMSDAYISPHCRIIDGSMIAISPPIISPAYFILECQVEFDHEFTGMHPSVYLPFADYCMLATKNFIAVQQTIDIDAAKITAGAALGEYKDTVDRYKEDASDEIMMNALNQIRASVTLSDSSLNRVLFAAL